MKLSFILELLLILVLIAYAAQARIINGNGKFFVTLINFDLSMKLKRVYP